MADRVYPSSKPPTDTANHRQTLTTTNGTTTNGGATAFPATKAQLYGASRPAYRPQPPPRRRRRRSCCCAFCLWTTLLIITLLLAAAVAAAVVYVLYRPHRPSFDVSSLRINRFNVTSSNKLTTSLNLTISARNPNKKLVFFYDPIAVAVSADGVDVGAGIIPAFTHTTKNTTLLKSTLSTSNQDLTSSSDSKLSSDLKNKNRLSLKIQLKTKVKVKLGGIKTSKLPIRVSCNGIQASLPTGTTPATASTSAVKCKVEFRVKIWKWTI